MRQVNIRKLRSGLASELKDLPFEVTKGGVVVAVVDYPEIKLEPGRAVMPKPDGYKVYEMDGRKSKPVPVYFNPQPKKK